MLASHEVIICHDWRAFQTMSHNLLLYLKFEHLLILELGHFSHNFFVVTPANLRSQ